MIRVYSPYSRSLYFIDKGRERGLGAELVRDFERWVNQKYAKRARQAPADRLHRRGDARQAAHRPQRRSRRHRDRQPHGDRGAPEGRSTSSHRTRRSSTSEILVDRPGVAGDRVDRRPLRQDGPRAQGIELLREPDRAERAAARGAGKPEADARPRSRRARRRGHAGDDERRPARRRWSSTTGRRRLWSQVLPKIKVRDDIVLRAPTKKGWAIRKNSPQLAAVAERFLRELGQEGRRRSVSAAAVHEEHQER